MLYDWHAVLGVGASVLMLSLVYPYVRSILHSTTKPSPVSWFGWSLLYGIATIAQASKGIDWSLAVPLISTFSTAIIAVVALRTGRAVWTRADRVSIAIALAAIILWAITREPLTAIVLGIVADFAVTIPTLVKTYQEPESEPITLWVLYTVSVVLAIAATSEFTIYNLLFPAYSLLTDIAITVLALRSNIIFARARNARARN